MRNRRDGEAYLLYVHTSESSTILVGATMKAVLRGTRGSAPAIEAHGPSRAWVAPVFLSGAACGFLVGIALTPRREREAAMTRSFLLGWSQFARVWEETMETWAATLEKARAPLPVDIEALEGRLKELPGGGTISVHLLDSGIIEIIGNMELEENRRAVLDSAAEEAGVRIVLNRIWLGAPATRFPQGAELEAERKSAGDVV